MTNFTPDSVTVIPMQRTGRRLAVIFDTNGWTNLKLLYERLRACQSFPDKKAVQDGVNSLLARFEKSGTEVMQVGLGDEAEHGLLFVVVDECVIARNRFNWEMLAADIKADPGRYILTDEEVN
ncbi:MAG: hypothetical protein FOGNACKC_00878 [Anaerolineae bacterium]|nr:hypothetical protein [Anaerolineae bacterium]